LGTLPTITHDHKAAPLAEGLSIDGEAALSVRNKPRMNEERMNSKVSVVMTVKNDAAAARPHWNR